MDDLSLAQQLAKTLKDLTGPEGEEGLRNAYPTPPDTISAVPALAIFPGTDAITYGAANRTTTLTLTARVYLRFTADLARRFATLHRWRAWLRDGVLADFQLNGLCDVARVTGTRFGDEEFGGEQFLTVEADIEITKSEHVNVGP